MRGYKDEGVVLGRKNLGEADRLIHVYSKNRGKVTLLAKGVRKPRSRKRGHLEVFSHIRFSVATTKSIDLMTEVETLEDFEKVRDSLRKASVAYYFVEVVDKLTREGEKNYELFVHLLDGLKGLVTTKQLKSYREDFARRVLVLTGFWEEGRNVGDVDRALEHFAEKKIGSVRVGKKIST